MDGTVALEWAWWIPRHEVQPQRASRILALDGQRRRQRRIQSAPDQFPGFYSDRAVSEYSAGLDDIRTKIKLLQQPRLGAAGVEWEPILFVLRDRLLVSSGHGERIDARVVVTGVRAIRLDTGAIAARSCASSYAASSRFCCGVSPGRSQAAVHASLSTVYAVVPEYSADTEAAHEPEVNGSRIGR
jgi:hypothetical protein